ncbi:hypothetical protein [Desulfocucumis palustris]|uniref:hypothetical protein n=1 Tax=Desulfocucumis palustris TaxID=1898651 RepID=UPI001A9A50AF|nr:hypothetical protein [Desulfocucumis palustris]
MTLDELNDNDEVFQVEGLTFVAKKGLMEKISPVKIDYKVNFFEKGFVIAFGSGMLPPDNDGPKCALSGENK